MHRDLVASLAAALAPIVGAEHVLVEPSARSSYETDWTARYRGRALLVVRPGSPAEVAATLRACRAHGATVVPQGGNTGLVAGATPYEQVVLATTRLDRLEPVDVRAAEVTVGAGATLEAVQVHTAPAGLAPAVDLAARGSATIGGMVATDAGGIHVLRHGSMRDQVVGIEAVLADGRIVGHAHVLTGDAAGLDLMGVLPGSEGTLGIVTAVRLRLVPVWPHRATALVAMEGAAAAVAATATLRERLADLDAVEYLDPAGLSLVAAHAGLQAPFGDAHAAYLLVEAAGRRPTLAGLADALVGLSGLRDAALADDGPGCRRLWAYRERMTEAIAAVGVAHKLDVGVPAARIGAFIDGLESLVAGVDASARVVVFGHLAVGNLHVNVLGPEPDDDRVDDAILARVIEEGGTIGAEHGIGRAKARWLPRAAGPAAMARAAAVKRALDPHGLLNPGVTGRMAIDRSAGNSDIMTRN